MFVSNKLGPHFDREIFAGRLRQAIKRRGLTYIRAAELVRERLPEGLSVSHTSIWLYAAARSAPRRVEVFRALCDVFEIGRATSGDDLPPAKNERSLENEIVFTINDSRPEVQLILRDSGRGVAFISFEAEVEWEKALQIATILRNDGSDDGTTREAPHQLRRASATESP